MTIDNGLLNRIHSDDRPLVDQESAQSLVEGFGAQEYRFKCKDGKYHWLADHFSIIRDKTGTTRLEQVLSAISPKKAG